MRQRGTQEEGGRDEQELAGAANGSTFARVASVLWFTRDRLLRCGCGFKRASSHIRPKCELTLLKATQIGFPHSRVTPQKCF